MTVIERIFGLEDASPEGIKLARIMAVMLPAFAASFQISTTFWMIQIAESLGGGDYNKGLTLVGFLVILQLVIQTALDYPTGALGDHIGQRFVIASALLCYAVAFWLTSTVTVDTPFFVFALIYGLMGFGASQESGAFNAWFDNNYRVAMPDDKDRKQYGVFMGKVGMLFQAMSTLVLLPGSWLALIYNREFVFRIQAVFCVFLAFVVLRIIRDLPGVNESTDEEKTLSEYVGLMKEGVGFLRADKFVMLTILGEVLIWATGTVWWTLLLFPLYFSYLLSDVAVSAFRTLVFIPEAGVQERSGVWSKRFDPVKWIPRFRFLQFCGFVFYLILSAITFLYPPVPSDTTLVGINIPFTNIPLIEMPASSIIPIGLLFVVFVITDMFGGFSQILTSRVMIDVIPSRIRNSMYSLKPTLAMILAIPLLGLFGLIQPLFGFGVTFGLLSIVSLLGALLIRQGFKHPIPKIEEVVKASSEEQAEVAELEIT
ncbi:MAG: MFS transporter [Candidatus Lokiarchaeota archaeon]|nr:MFS transporter [Candidatus Lokiarchaeota archaeon]